MSDPMLQVTDTNANAAYPLRKHDVLNDDGSVTTYEFCYGAATKMPLHHGMKFLVDDAFIVTDEKGHRIDPRPKRAQEQEAALALKPGQVVADLEELTVDALFVRCQMLPGSEGMKKNTKKGDMIEFLLQSNGKSDGVQPAAGGKGNGKLAEQSVEDATPVDVDPDDDMSDIFGDEDDG